MNLFKPEELGCRVYHMPANLVFASLEEFMQKILVVEYPKGDFEDVITNLLVQSTEDRKFVIYENSVKPYGNRKAFNNFCVAHVSPKGKAQLAYTGIDKEPKYGEVIVGGEERILSLPKDVRKIESVLHFFTTVYARHGYDVTKN